MYKKPDYSVFLCLLLLFVASCQTDPGEALPITGTIQEGSPDPQKLGELRDWYGQHEPALNQQAEDLANARQNNLDRFMVPFVEKLPD